MTRATALVEETRTALAEAERAIAEHPLLDAVERGGVSREALRRFAGEQRFVIASDRRSFAHLAARFPEEPAGSLFLALAGGEGEALARLSPLAEALGLSEDEAAAFEPSPGCQAYPAFVAWLALNGQRADVVLAFLVNLAAWGAACGRLRAALAERYGVPSAALGFLDFFADPDPELEQRFFSVLEHALDAGDDPVRARRAARLLQAYELLWWDSVGART